MSNSQPNDTGKSNTVARRFRTENECVVALVHILAYFRGLDGADLTGWRVRKVLTMLANDREVQLVMGYANSLVQDQK